METTGIHGHAKILSGGKKKKQAQTLNRHTRQTKERTPQPGQHRWILSSVSNNNPSDLLADTWCVHQGPQAATPDSRFSLTWAPLPSQPSSTATCSSSCEAVWPWSFTVVTSDTQTAAAAASLHLALVILSTDACVFLSVSKAPYTPCLFNLL